MSSFLPSFHLTFFISFLGFLPSFPSSAGVASVAIAPKIKFDVGNRPYLLRPCAVATGDGRVLPVGCDRGGCQTLTFPTHSVAAETLAACVSVATECLFHCVVGATTGSGAAARADENEDQSGVTLNDAGSRPVAPQRFEDAHLSRGLAGWAAAVAAACGLCPLTAWRPHSRVELGSSLNGAAVRLFAVL